MKPFLSTPGAALASIVAAAAASRTMIGIQPGAAWVGAAWGATSLLAWFRFCWAIWAALRRPKGTHGVHRRPQAA